MKDLTNTDRERLLQWQEDAIRTLQHARDPASSFHVLKRTLESATRRCVVKLTRGSWQENASVKRERRQSDGRNELVEARIPKRSAAIAGALGFTDALNEGLPENCQCKDDIRRLRIMCGLGESLVSMLLKHFGTSVEGLCTELLKHIDDDCDESTLANTLKSMRDHTPVPDVEEEEVLALILGRRAMTRFFRRQETIGESLDVLARIVARSSTIRQRLLDGLSLFAHAPDRLIASACVRQGYNELMEADAVGTDSVSIAQRIHCDWHRQELERVRRNHGWLAATAKQRAIIGDVYAMTFQYEHPHDGLKPKPGFVTSTPRYTLTKKKANCFSGPWLIAMLLLRSGFKENQLFWCKVLEMHEGVLGSHGALIARTDGNDLILIDHGGRIVSRDLLLSDIENKNTEQRLKGLVEGTDQIVNIHNPSWRERKIHPRMQVMPLATGIAAGHLAHVAMAALDKNRWAEADHAARLAMNFNPGDPDVLHMLGFCQLSEKNVTRAEAYFRRGLEAFPKHAGCLLHLGESLLSQGRTDEALPFLKQAEHFGEETWEGKPYVARAKRLQRKAEKIRREKGKSMD